MNRTVPARPARLISRVFTRPIAMLIAATVVAAILSAVTVSLQADSARAASSASAASILKSFDAENIISDQVMYNSSTMSQAAIQTFLNAEQPTCASGFTCLKTFTANTQTMTKNLMCGSYAGADNETAAAIIYKVAKACKINPQVILVVLQKEQSLITGVNLAYYPNAYRSATGLGCPDTAACDPAKYGFFNQVYGLGYWLIRYTTPPGTTGSGWTSYSWFPVGSPVGVQYNPSTSCGFKALTIANKATASLYYYTPYTPNAASIAAGWGAASSCGAYGNRNFYLYFVSWFGSTHYTVSGAIKTAWSALGGAKGSLGNATGNAVVATANGGGSSQTFEHGTVYSSPAGTFALTGAILTRYTTDGGPAGPLGWPRLAVSTRAKSVHGGGSVQGFTGGTVYVSAAGAFAVTGGSLTAYNAAGHERGAVAWPTSEAVASTATGGGTVQTFQGGTVYAGASATPALVSGAVLTEYLRRGGPASTLGWPTGAQAAVSENGGGVSQKFGGGAIYSSSTGTIGVLGVLQANYASHRGPAGVLGWPTGIAHVSTVGGGGATQTFQHGEILWSAAGGTRAFATGAVLKEYLRRSGPAGTMGWPISSTTKISAHGGGTETTFQSGVIDSSKHGTIAVRGDLLVAYLKVRGPSGDLGWPTTGATKAKSGVWTQHFMGGSITWSAKAGAKIHFT